MRLRLVAIAIAGFAAPVLVVAYYLAVLALVEPVDWIGGLSLALWFSPITAAAALVFQAGASKYDAR